MTKYFLLLATFFLLSGCVNKHGVSAKYYSECKEYYDLQGYYHKKCGEDDIVTYKALGNGAKQLMDDFTNTKQKPKGNVF